MGRRLRWDLREASGTSSAHQRTGSETRHYFQLLIYHGIHRIARTKLRVLVCPYSIRLRLGPTPLVSSLLLVCACPKVSANINWSDRNPSLRRPNPNQRS
jgi:hypothetical protein